VAHKKIDLAVAPAALLRIIDLTSASAGAGTESQTRMLRQFVVLLLCPPAPFVNSLADPVTFSEDLLKGHQEDPAKTRQRQILASVLAAAKSEIAKRVFDLGLLLDVLAEPLALDAAKRMSEHEHALTFWTSVAQDLTVRRLLQDQRLPFALYKLLRSQGSEEGGGMLTKASTQVVTGIVDLVKTLVAGHETLEGELADLLIEDLAHLSRHRDMDFVNKVFIPLIKVERALPVTLGAARSITESGQPALLPGISSLVESGEAVAQGSSSFLSTELLQQKQKDYLKAAFLQVVGDKTSKAQADKLLGSSWSKVHEWSTSPGENPEHLADLGLWRQLEGRGPCVMLTTGRSPSGQPAIFGAFW